MAKITFKGNIGKDAVLRKVQNGDHMDSVLSIWVAENIKKRDGSKKAVWHKVTLWRGFAEALAPYLKAGRRIEVEGRSVKADWYKDRNGAIVPYLDIQADEIELLDGKKPEDDLPPDEVPAAPTTPVTPVAPVTPAAPAAEEGFVPVNSDLVGTPWGDDE